MGIRLGWHDCGELPDGCQMFHLSTCCSRYGTTKLFKYVTGQAEFCRSWIRWGFGNGWDRATKCQRNKNAGLMGCKNGDMGSN